MKIILKAGILFLRLIYCVYKLFPIKNRIVFFSRQSNEASVDAMLLANEVYKKDSQVQIIQEFKCIPDSWEKLVIVFICLHDKCIFLLHPKLLF